MRTLIYTPSRVLVALLILPALAIAQTTKPSAKAASDAKDSDASPRLALAHKIPQVKIQAIPLSDAIDFVRDISSANIHVNWRALELLNVTRQTPVSVTLNNVPVSRVLRSILDDTGSGQLLTYYVDEGVIEITTREISDGQMITKVYPVEDLVMQIPNFEGPTFNLQNQSNNTSGQGGGGGGGQSLFSGSSGSGSGSGGANDQTVSKQQQADGLVKLIQETVRPEVWREAGGTASIRYFNGHLIVTAPRSVHEALSASGR